MCKSGCHGCPALHRRTGPLAPHDNHALAEGHRFGPALASYLLLCCWSAHKSLAPRARTLLGVLGHATLNFVAVATLLFCFFCECPKFFDPAKQRRKLFLGVSEVGKIDFALYFCWLCVFFVIFYILLLRSRGVQNKVTNLETYMLSIVGDDLAYLRLHMPLLLRNERFPRGRPPKLQGKGHDGYKGGEGGTRRGRRRREQRSMRGDVASYQNLWSFMCCSRHVFCCLHPTYLEASREIYLYVTALTALFCLPI